MSIFVISGLTFTLANTSFGRSFSHCLREKSGQLVWVGARLAMARGTSLRAWSLLPLKVKHDDSDFH